MDPNIWGPHAWIFLHSITYNYPEKPSSSQQKSAINFFKSLRYLLPCSICKDNYADHLIQNPIENNVQSRKKIVKWLIDIHNDVNSILGKPFVSSKSIENNPLIKHCEFNIYNILFLTLLLLLLRFL